MDVATNQLVRQRAADRCEYCRLPEEFSGLRFHIEHIVARQHGGSDDPRQGPQDKRLMRPPGKSEPGFATHMIGWLKRLPEVANDLRLTCGGGCSPMPQAARMLAPPPAGAAPQ